MPGWLWRRTGKLCKRHAKFFSSVKRSDGRGGQATTPRRRISRAAVAFSHLYALTPPLLLDSVQPCNGQASDECERGAYDNTVTRSTLVCPSRVFSTSSYASRSQSATRRHCRRCPFFFFSYISSFFFLRKKISFALVRSRVARACARPLGVYIRVFVYVSALVCAVVYYCVIISGIPIIQNNIIYVYVTHGVWDIFFFFFKLIAYYYNNIILYIGIQT